MPELTISVLQPDEGGLWDAYVRRTQGAGFFHLSGWRNVITRTYGHETRYLIARDGDEIRGVLPLFVIRNRLLGTSISTPPGAILASDTQAGQALLAHAIAYADEIDADGVALTASQQLWDGDLVTVQRHVTQVVALPPNPDTLWKEISRHKRKNVNKARREGLEVVFGRTEYADFFYDIFALNLRDLGTPVFDRRLLDNIFAEFPDQTQIAVARHNGQPVGGLLFFTVEKLIHAMWMASDNAVRDLRPNDLMYWEVMSWGAANGYDCCDTGRSQWDSGNFKFKQLWNATTRPLYYQHYLRKGSSVPDLDYKTERVLPYRLAIAAWKHLPLGVSRRLGPTLRKNLYPL